MDEINERTWKMWPHTMAKYLTKNGPKEHKYKTPKHVKLISNTIVKMIDEGGGLLLIEAPPRHSKSETVSRWLPVWFLSNFPHRHVVLASYSASLAEGNGYDVRSRILEYGKDIGIEVAGDSSAVAAWRTSQGGSCRSVGVGGSLTGFGGHLIILDDLCKDAEEAESEVMRAKVVNWFSSVAWTRREPGCLVVIMATRWHEGDLTGWVLSHPELSKTAKRIRLPALAEEHDILGRQIGEPLWPEHYDEERLRSARMGLSERWWNALFQQRPTSEQGGEIKRHWFRYYDELPVPAQQMDMRVMSVDASFRDTDGSDYVVIQSWGIYGTRRYLLDQVRARMGFVDTVKAILTSREKHLPHAIVVEAKANGDAILETLSREGVSELVAITPKASKQARARAASPQIEAGNVFLPKCRFSDELVEESAAFPLGKHDDQVDCMSQFLNYIGDMRSNPVSHLRDGDDRFVPPDMDNQRNTQWRSVFDRVRRSV